MKLNKTRELKTSAIAESATFDLSHEDASHIMVILRDTLYSDKIMAVLREYSANAWDAHRMVEKGDAPIKVTLPTVTESTLKIRDFGPGLSQEQVFDVYTKYGKSTKRDTNSAVGMLGIGSKSGFAYTDSFYVTSWHGGEKSLYSAVLDESDKGVMNLMHREECDPDETGIEIQIAIEQDDIPLFNERARRLYKYFDPRPEINLVLPDLPSGKYVLEHGELYPNRAMGYYEREWIAVMGCVPYRLDLSKVGGEDELNPVIENVSGVLRFDIGDVDINASREELKYSDSTKKAIIAKINALVDEFVQKSLERISKIESIWERRLGASNLRVLGFSEIGDVLSQSSVRWPVGDEAPKTFKPMDNDNRSAAAHIPVEENTRLLIKDSPRSIRGYSLSHHDIVLRVNGTVEECEEELAEFIEKMEIDGIKVLKMSQLDWQKPWVSPSSEDHAEKHRKSLFKMVENPYFRHPPSKDWTPVDRVPGDDDVFVILNRFHAGDEFPRWVGADKKLFEFFKIDFPEVYGYKTTKAKPILPKDCSGTEYSEWRRKAYKRIAESKTGRRFVQLHEWAENYFHASAARLSAKRVGEALGESSEILDYIRKSRDLNVAYSQLKRDVKKHASNLHWELRRLGIIDEEKGERRRALSAIEKKYPLLLCAEVSFQEIWISREWKHWLEYVRLVDWASAQKDEGKDGERTTIHDDGEHDLRDVGGQAGDGPEERAKLHRVA